VNKIIYETANRATIPPSLLIRLATMAATPTVNIVMLDPLLSSSSQTTQPSTPPPVDATVVGMELSSSFPPSGGGDKRCRGADDTTEEDDADDGQPRRKRARLTDMHPDDLLRKILLDEIGMRYKSLPAEVSITTGGKRTVEAALSDAHVQAHLRPCRGETYIVHATETDLYPENKDEQELHRDIAGQDDIFEHGLAVLGSGSEPVSATAGPLRIIVRQCHEPAQAVSLLEGVDVVEVDAPGTHFINQWVVGLAERLGVELQLNHFLGLDIFQEATSLSSKKFVNYEALWVDWPGMKDKWLAGRPLGLLPRQWSIPLGFNSTQFPSELSQWVDGHDNPPSYTPPGQSRDPAPTVGQEMAQNRVAWRLRYQRCLLYFLGLLSLEPVISGSNFSAFPGSSSGAAVPRGLPADRPLTGSIQRAGRGGQLYYLGQMIVKLAVYASGYRMGTDWLLELLGDTADMTLKEVMGAMFLVMHSWYEFQNANEQPISTPDRQLLSDLAAGKRPGCRHFCADAEARDAAIQLMLVALENYGMDFGVFIMTVVRELIAPHETYFTPKKFGLSLKQLVAATKGEVPCEHTDALRALQLAILRGEIPPTAYPHLTAACTMKRGYLVEMNGMNVMAEAEASATHPFDGTNPQVMWPASSLPTNPQVMWPVSSLPVGEWEKVLWELVACRLSRWR